MARRVFPGRASTVFHKEWAIATDSGTGVSTAVGTVTAGATSLVSNGPLTLLRTRGMIGAQLDAGAADERILVVFGIVKMTSSAVAAGGAALPGPVTETGADWLWIGSLWLSALAEAAVRDDALFDRLELDSKAMRKIGVDEEFVLIAEVAEAVTPTGTWDFQYVMRMLTGN